MLVSCECCFRCGNGSKQRVLLSEGLYSGQERDCKQQVKNTKENKASEETGDGEGCRWLFHTELSGKASQIMCVHVCSVTQSCLILCDSMDHSPPGSSVPEILQARILEWVAMPHSRESSQPWDQTHISYISCVGRQVLYH